MEMFGGRGLTPLAIVDYAHTPDALAKALGAARLHCRGQLRVVFGCGGDRDAGKRPLMGRIAAELADDIVVTDDNPRTEDPARIVADILAGISGGAGSVGGGHGAGGADAADGARGAGRAVGARAPPVVIEHDRALAIRLALQNSGPDDVVLVAGKGHEDYQIYGKQRRPFVDQAIVTAALERRRV
jgi:UDP-N-acetylmuramoyl-L-alanyl-D-glutamate--2,6-diaminopimelate ligase